MFVPLEWSSEDEHQGAIQFRDAFVPLLKENEKLTSEEKTILAQIKQKYPIRSVEKSEEELQKELNIEHAKEIAEKLAVGDYIAAGDKYYVVSSISGDFMCNLDRTNADGTHWGEIGEAGHGFIGNWKEQFVQVFGNETVLHMTAEEFALESAKNHKDENEEATYKIYQLKQEERYHFAVTSLDQQLSQLNIDDYDCVYEGKLSEIEVTDEYSTRLDNIRRKINGRYPPEDYKGAKVGLSDVVVFEENGEQTAQYIDDYGYSDSPLTFTEFPEFFMEKELVSVADKFRAETEKHFHSIDGYTSLDIESKVRYGLLYKQFKGEIGDIIVTGSRSRGLENADSDIDVVVEVKDSDLKEDELFNILHEDEWEIGGVTVDINPIRPEETGTLETYLPTVESYLAEKMEKLKEESKRTDEVTYKIYQLKEGEEYHYARFESFDRQQMQLNMDDYDLLYEGNLSDIEGRDLSAQLENIYAKFNINHPEDFRGHSLSVSDVVVIENNGEQTAHYVDSYGFTDFPAFFKEKELESEKSTAVEPIAEEQQRTVDDIKPGDIYRYRDEKYTVTDKKGIYPNDVVISKQVKSYVRDHWETYEITSNVDKFELHNKGVFLGNDTLKKENVDLQIGDHVEVKGKHWAVESVNDFLISLVNLNPDDNNSGMTLTNWKRNLEYKKIGGFGLPQKKKKTQNPYTMPKMKKKIKALSSTENFYENVRQIVGYYEDVYHSDKNINEIHRLADAQFEYLKELEATQMSLFEIPQEQSLLEDVNQLEFSTSYGEDFPEIDTVATTIPPQDFTITDDELSVGGAKTRFRANMDAIKTLKTIEAENRNATPEEQVILSKYVGWGGLKQAFEDFHADWQKEYAELRETLTPEEYKSASASVLDAFYTSPKIIDSIYTALEKNGFKGGRILEPSMAIGNFFGKMPTDMREKSSLYGVELDSISGRIAQKLYPSADIQITGFEKTKFKDNSFDLAIGNVPFGDISLHEKEYDKHHFKIHDHFFAKALDKVKGNGIVAFITSTGTLDKKNSAVRKYLAERAELVGAIRLPSGAFKASAGTDVDSDIIFLQKRPQPIELTQDTVPSWVELGETQDGLPINNYFAEHPEMVLGKMVEGNKMFGREGTSCVAIEGTDLNELLKNAVKNIRFETTQRKDENDIIENDREVQIPLGTRSFSYAVVNDKLYYRSDNEMQLYEGNKKDEQRIKDILVVRDTLRKLFDAQINDYAEETIKDLQAQLNLAYDQYVEKHGRIHDKANQSALSDESSLPLLTSLERYKGETFEGKAAIFSERTIHAKVEITHVDNANEALVVSLSEKGCVDIDYMQQLTDKDAETLLVDLKGVVYENPLMLDENGKPHLETADEYLSGNIRKKLEAMKEHYGEDARYTHNIEALEKAMPIPLQAGDIDVHLGSAWLDPLLIQEFMYERMKTPYSHRESELDRKYNRSKSSTIRVLYSEPTATWSITNKSQDKNNEFAKAKFGTSRISPYQILEDCLNLKATVVKDKLLNEEGKEISVVNKDESDFAQEKQRELKEAFAEWIYANPERRDAIVEKYNILFNSSRPREYDGSHLSFPEMNAEITLRPHQKDAIAHALYGGNTLFAHEVGAGKTFEMIGSIMEGKRLGLHKKALMCVPNHLTEQMGADFVKLYPNANILVATAKDFEKKNRKKLFAKIATGDYDAVIIGHSQLVRLPISEERQERLVQKEIDELTECVSELKANNGERFHVAQLEKMIKKLQEKLQKLVDAPRRDDEVYFEELGIDKLVLDEAHEFKNLFVATKLSNISGVATNENVQKTFDLYLKCQYLDEITNGKGIIFATGTPVSNSISEIHSLMKYLQSELLNERNMSHFDAWASNFAEIVTDSQLSPEGNKYQLKTRFARFNNMPELMAMFKECADIKTTDQLGLDIPECTIETVVAEPTEIQLEMMKELGERSDKIRSGRVDPKVDNMPLICTDGRKNGLDVRLLNPELPDSEGTKVNLCVNNVFKIWDETAQDRLTQLVFCDMGVPVSKADKKKGIAKFSVYDDIKEKLMAKGVPEKEIAFIHDAKTEIEKDRLFAKVRSGEIRVLLGSTRKMGTGTNVQDLIIASHDLDAPYKPSELEQRRGRMVRQGNKNKHVKLFRYVTEGTFDAYNYQILENKQAFGSQIMTSKSAVRSCEDVDDVQMSFATCKALCVQNPLIKERMELETEVAKLKMLKGKHTNEQQSLQDKVTKDIPQKIQGLSIALKQLEADKKVIDSVVIPVDEKGNKQFYGIEIGGKQYTDKEDASEKLLEACEQAVLEHFGTNTPVGHYKGFEIRAGFDSLSKNFTATLVGEGKYRVELGAVSGIFTRLDNALSNFDTKIDDVKKQIQEQNEQLELTKKELGKPFSREEEFQEKFKRLEYVVDALENGQREEPTNHIEEPYLIEVKTQDDIEKIKEAGIVYDIPETNDGKMIIRVDRNDADKAKELIGNDKSQKLSR